MRWVGTAGILAAALSFAPGVRGGNGRPEDSVRLAEGLKLFRTPGLDGRACSMCHSPDGIELAAFAFDRSTLVRRATPHLGAERAEQLADYILLFRKGLPFKPFDPMRDRPMQPGGRLLAGKTPRDRDGTLERELPRLIPTLCGSPIHSMEAAQRARNEALAIDIANLPVGIEMSRLSEDEFHGPEHATLENWIADKPPIQRDKVRPLEETYLADPSDANLDAILGVQDQRFGELDFGSQVPTAKREALLLLTHRLRTGRAYVPPPTLVDPVVRVLESWGIWSDVSSLNDSSVDIRKTARLTMTAQKENVMTSWGWLSLSLVPDLRAYGMTVNAVRRSMGERYPMHLALFEAVREASLESSTKPNPVPNLYPDRTDFYPLQERAFYFPFGAPALYRRVILNTARMAAWLKGRNPDAGKVERSLARLGN